MSVLPLSSVIDALSRFYGRLPSPPSDPFAFLVWEILSMGAAPAKRDLALGALRRIPALTADAVWKSSPAKLEAAVALAGPYREQRLSAIRATAERFRRNPVLPALIRGPLRAARHALSTLPQPGDATPRHVLLFTTDRPLLPIDGRVTRVASRIGYGRDGNEDNWGTASRASWRRTRTVHRAILRELPKDAVELRRVYLYLSHHGGATCTDVAPRCQVCPLRDGCPWAAAHRDN